VKNYIEVRYRFEGVHCWPDAPLAVNFLRQPHRHEFHVRARLAVTHDDRELEFILVKQHIKFFVLSRYPMDLGTRSCEQMAAEIIKSLAEEYGANRYIEVEVSEDGENGAVVVNE